MLAPMARSPLTAYRLPFSMQWHLLQDGASDGATNMSRDLALLDLAAERGVAFVRTYTWTPHTLSFGANEPALKRYDRAAIDARRLAVVRRPTGGRAVWHAEELTYAVSAPDGALGALAESYRRRGSTGRPRSSRPPS